MRGGLPGRTPGVDARDLEVEPAAVRSRGRERLADASLEVGACEVLEHSATFLHAPLHVKDASWSRRIGSVRRSRSSLPVLKSESECRGGKGGYSAQSATKRKPAEGAAGNGDAKRDERALEELLAALTKAADGDFSHQLRAPPDRHHRRPPARVQHVLRSATRAMTRELGRVGRVVGREGRMTERASLGNVEGGWAEGDRVGQLAHRRPHPPVDRGRARDGGRGAAAT